MIRLIEMQNAHERALRAARVLGIEDVALQRWRALVADAQSRPCRPPTLMDVVMRFVREGPAAVERNAR
jgi:hypothetical protein